MKMGAGSSRAAALYVTGYLLRHSRIFLTILALSVAASVAAVATQYGIKLLVDAMSSPHTALYQAQAALGFLLAAVAAESILWRVCGWLGSAAIIRVGVDIRLDLFSNLAGQSMRFYRTQTTGALSSRLSTAAEAARVLLTTLLWNIVPPCADLIGSMVVLSTIAWQFSLGLLSGALLITVLVAWVGARGFPQHRAYYEQSAVTTGQIVDVISNVGLVKAFAAHEREGQRLGSLLAEEARTHRSSWRHLELTRATHDALLWTTAAAILLLAVKAWRHGAITAGDVILVTTLSFRMLFGARELALSALGLGRQLGAVADAIFVLRSHPSCGDHADAIPLQVCNGQINFHKLRFGYHGRGMLFDNFVLDVPAGQQVGIVGTSGAGKSTLLRLVQRLDEPQSGCILINGQDIRHITQDSLAASIAVVTQDVEMFHRSVLENISYGRPEASMAEVIAAARAARCEEFVRQMPRHYHTIVGERGAMLSGGQRQRLAIARAILKDAPILLLDEATSALDTESEIAVQLALKQLIRGRTVLAVAHRLSTLMAFDRVIVLADGQIVEDGHPALLSRAAGPFARMWSLQDRREAV